MDVLRPKANFALVAYVRVCTETCNETKQRDARKETPE